MNQLVGIVDTPIENGCHKFAILISSTGGETTSAFTAYNYLRGLNVEITTFNIGDVDSAARVLYCAGSKRYSLPNTRFLLHGAAVGVPGNSFVNAEALEGQLALVNNQNQITVHVISATTSKKEPDLHSYVRGQTVLNPEEAKKLGLVEEIKTDFLPSDSAMVTSLAAPPPPLHQHPRSRLLPPIETSPDWKLTGTSVSQ